MDRETSRAGSRVRGVGNVEDPEVDCNKPSETPLRLLSAKHWLDCTTGLVTNVCTYVLVSHVIGNHLCTVRRSLFSL
uniref:Uncharacterized protein n=1 Tax=Physcomitrium patens TaxID=3218 RepID=A0A2K1J9Y9_PHYPA|nr:hypothetical protein PHYPA_021459 [Physcomitrium patens]